MSEPTLLLTRPTGDSADFLSEVEAAAGHAVAHVISPLLRIEATGEVPDLSGFRSVVVTSRHAVAVAGDRLGGRIVFCVGERTADAARAAGADARCLGADVEAFLARVDEVVPPAIHLHGRHVRGDLAARAKAEGVDVEEAVIYEQVALPLSDAATALLRSGTRVVAPLFSPRTAELFATEGARSAEGVSCVAMSDAVADSLRGAFQVRVADEPTRSAMTREVLAALRG